MPVTKHRPCCLPPGRAYLPSKEGTLGRGAPWACAASAPRWDPWSPSTLCCQAVAQELLGLVGSGGPGWGAVCCTWGRGKAARRAHAASSAHPSMPTWPYHLGRSGKGMRGWQAGSPEGRGGLAGAAQDPCLLSSLPSLWAASSSQGLSGPGRGCSALSVSPWQPTPPSPPRRGDGSAPACWSWVSAQSSWGFPADAPGIWSWALPLGLVLQGLCRLGAQGPAGVRDHVQHLCRAGQRAWALGAQAEGRVGQRGRQPPFYPVSFGCMSWGPSRLGFHPGGSRGSLSAASGGWVGGWALAAGLTGENKWSSLVF